MPPKFFRHTLTAVATLLVLSSLLAAPAAAQADNETNGTNANEAPVDETRVDVDGNLEISEWEWSDGHYHVTLHAESATTAYILQAIDATDDAGSSAETRTVDLDDDESRTASIAVDGPVMVTSDAFFDTGAYAVIEHNSAIVGGPYGPEDTWVAAGVTAGSIGLVVVLRVLAHLLGVGQTTERVA